MTVDWLPSIDRASTALGWTLLHSFWQAALFWFGIRAIASRAIDPRTRYAAANAVLALFLAIQAATFVACMLWDWIAPPWMQPSMPQELTLSGGIIGPPATIGGWVGDLITRVEPMLPWLIAAWGGWAALRLVAQIRGARAASRTLSLAPPLPEPLLDRCVALTAAFSIRRPVKFVAAAISDAPGTLGWLRPYVFIPPAILLSMTPAQLEAFVAHELAHVARRDYAAAMLALAVDACYACNPFIGAIVRQLQADAELCCDRLAVGHVGDAHGYATALATLAENIVKRQKPKVSLGANGGALVDRVLSILHPTPIGGSSWSKAVASLAIAAALLVTSGASLAKVASRESEARWFSTRTLGESVIEILGPNPDPSFPKREMLLRLARSERFETQPALMSELRMPETLEQVTNDPAARIRLISASTYANARNGDLLSRFEQLATTSPDSPKSHALLKELRLSSLAQHLVGNRARVLISADAAERWASAASSAFPGELDLLIERLRQDARTVGRWETVDGSRARLLTRPPAPDAATTRKADK